MPSVFIPSLPISVNSAYYFIRMGKRTIKRKREEAYVWTRNALWYFWNQNPNHVPLTKDKKVVVTLIFLIDDNRHHDIDNMQKLLLDCYSLKHTKDINKKYDTSFQHVWIDDGQIVRLISVKQKSLTRGTIIDISEVD